MAVAHESNGAGGTGNSVASVSWSHTIGGSDRFLVIVIGYFRTPSATGMDLVTVGGAPAFCIGRSINDSYYSCEVWGFVAPPTGAQTVVATWPFDALDIAANSSNYTGVDETFPYGVVAIANGLDATPTVDVTSASGELVVDGIYHDHTDTLTVDGSQSEKWQQDPPSNDGTTAHSTQAGDTSVTMSWSLSGSEEWAIVGFSLRPTETTTIEWESNGAGDNGSGITELSWSHTVSGSNTYLVIVVGEQNGAGRVVSSIDVAGSAASLIARNTTSIYKGELWGIKAPTSGTITVTFSGTVDDAVANSTNYTGVDQTAPLGTAASATGTSTTPSVAVSSAADELVVDCIFHNDTDTMCPDGSQIGRWHGIPPMNDGGLGHSNEAGDTSVTMSWLMSGSEPWTIVGVPLKPVAVAVSGTATASIDEDDITTGGKTVIIMLTGDTWVTAGATFEAQRQNIIDGMDAAASPANGWNDEVRDKEVVGAVVRTSDTVVTITLTAAALYDVSATETITVTVPATALVTSGSALIATPTFTVDAIAVGGVLPLFFDHYRKLRAA